MRCRGTGSLVAAMGLTVRDDERDIHYTALAAKMRARGEDDDRARGGRDSHHQRWEPNTL